MIVEDADLDFLKSLTECKKGDMVVLEGRTYCYDGNNWLFLVREGKLYKIVEDTDTGR